MVLEHGFFPPYGGEEDGVGTHKDWLTLTPKELNQVPIDNDYDSGVEVSQKDKATQMIIRQRNAYRKIIFSRYHEIILNIRDYINVPVSFNRLKCEYFLRSGMAVVNFFADRLAELMASRLSLILQAKVTSVIPVENGNSEDANQIAANLLNGAPYLIMNKDRMRLKDMVVTIGDSSIPERIKTLKTAFNDEQNELNNMLGINTVGVDKASGVSDKEADSNNDYVTSTTNMYIRGVQHGLDLYNTRFHKKMYVYMNQPSLAELKLGGDD